MAFLNRRTSSYQYYLTSLEWFPENLWLQPEEMRSLLTLTREMLQSSCADSDGDPTKRPGSPRPRGWRPIWGRSGTPAERRTLCCRRNRLVSGEGIVVGWQQFARLRQMTRGHRQTIFPSFLTLDVPTWRRPRLRGPLLWPWPQGSSLRLIYSRWGRDEERGCEERSWTIFRHRGKPNELIRSLRLDRVRLWPRQIESNSSWFLWQRSEDKSPAKERQ